MNKLATDPDWDIPERITFFTKDEIKLISAFEISTERRKSLFKRARTGDKEAQDILSKRFNATIIPKGEI